MAIKQRQIVLTSQTADGDTVIDMPVTAMEYVEGLEEGMQNSNNDIKNWITDNAITLAPYPVMRRKIDIEGTAVKLYWADPNDVVLEGLAIAEWEHTVIVKKEGSYPESVEDGTVVLTNTVRNQYLETPYTDTQENAENWYYRAFPKSVGGPYSLNKLNRFGFWHYAISIDQNNPDEATCVEYLPGYDNYFLGAANMDFTLDKFNWGGWKNAPFMPKPCMLKTNGTVDYYLDPDDYTKKESGATSDVTNTSYDGNAMMEWGSIFVKVEKVGKKIFIYYTSEKIDNYYECYSTKKSDGTYAEHFYMPIYEGCNVSGKLRSMSTGTRPTGSTTAENEATYAHANGTGWETTVWADEQLMAIMGILLFKRLNFQVACGYNCGSSSSSFTHNCGSGNAKGMFYGKASTGTTATKYFGMENWWGHRWRRCNGLMLINYQYYVKLTHSTVDGSTVTGYNRTGNGYIATGITCPGASESYIKEIAGDPRCITAPVVVSGASSTTFFCDACWSAGGTTQLLLGGPVGSGVIAGLFAFSASNAPSNSIWNFGASLSYHGF